MNKVEFWPCSFEEYIAGEKDRVHEEDLSVNGLYTVMFSLEAMRVRQKATKCPGRVADIELRPDGLMHDVQFSLLNSDLEPTRQLKSVFYEGYLVARGKSAPTINVGYFTEYANLPTNQGLHTDVAVGQEFPLAAPEHEAVAA